MSSLELPPPPLIAPMPWKAGPGRVPLMTIVARNGVRTAAVDASVCGLATGAAVTVVPSATAIAAMAATLAGRRHVLTATRMVRTRPAM